ncbi:hypothetical protein C7271_14365, partial [filamentous cyanobacterium CCP5]
ASSLSQQVDTAIIDDVRNLLFGFAPASSARDLFAINIQRGRLNGLADYNDIRAAFGLHPVTNFSEITRDLEKQAALQTLYGSVDNIDAFVGMLAEDIDKDSSVGETVAAVLRDQFGRLRAGDRFYFENTFSKDEIKVLEKTRLSDIIARNTDSLTLPDNLFFLDKKQFGKADIDIETHLLSPGGSAATDLLFTQTHDKVPARVVQGSSVEIIYRVSNPGETPLGNVTVTSQAVAGAPTLRQPDPLLNGRFNVGDTNQDQLLNPGETWRYRLMETASLGWGGQIGRVSADPVDYIGNPLGGKPVTDSDPVNYLSWRSPVSQNLAASLGDPKQIGFRYTGGGPEDTQTSQSKDHAEVIGDPKDDPTVYILASDSQKPDKGEFYFEGSVNLGDSFTVTAAAADKKQLGSKLYIHIFAEKAGPLLQTIRYDTSGKSPIVLGETVGGVTLTSYVGEYGAASRSTSGPQSPSLGREPLTSSPEPWLDLSGPAFPLGSNPSVAALPVFPEKGLDQGPAPLPGGPSPVFEIFPSSP